MTFSWLPATAVTNQDQAFSQLCLKAISQLATLRDFEVTTDEILAFSSRSILSPVPINGINMAKFVGGIHSR